jgi:hypothetical protein
MVLRFMRKNRRNLFILLLSGFVLFNSACAQNPPFTGKAYVKEQLSVEQATVLLNNEKQVSRSKTWIIIKLPASIFQVSILFSV